MPLSPRLIKYVVIAVVALVVLSLATAQFNRIVSFLPWSAESKRERLEKELALERDKRIAREIEAVAREQAARLSEAERKRAEEAKKHAEKLADEARRASPDKISPDRAARLRDARKRLCADNPRVC